MKFFYICRSFIHIYILKKTWLYLCFEPSVNSDFYSKQLRFNSIVNENCSVIDAIGKLRQEEGWNDA